MTTTKVTGLTGLNTKALQLAIEANGDDDLLDTLTATTFTYAGTPAEAVEWLDHVRGVLVAGGYRGNAHPVRSLAAVRKKFAAQ